MGRTKDLELKVNILEYKLEKLQMEAQKSVSILASKLKKVEEKYILSETENQESKKFSGYFRDKNEKV